MQLDLKATTHALGARAKYAGRMAKLTMEINAEREAIQAAYLEIGRVYCETHCDDSDPLLAQLCSEVREANQRIQKLQNEVDARHYAMRGDA